MTELPYWRLSGAYFFYFAYLGAFAPYFSVYLSTQGISAVGIGFILALPQFVRIFAPHLWGWLADRGHRCLTVARLATCAGTIAFCGLFVAQGFETLAIVVLTMSFLLSAALPLLEVVTFRHLGERASQYGRVRLWGSVGFIVAVLAVGYLLDSLAISALLWMLLVLLIGALLMLLWTPDAARGGSVHDAPPFLSVVKNPRVVALIAACALMAVAHGPYYTFYSIYLLELGYSKGEVGWLWSLGVICEIAIFIWMSHLFRAYTMRQVLIASFALTTLRFLLIAWCADSLVWLLVAQALHAASFGSFHAAALGLVNGYFPGHSQGRGQAVYNSLSFGLGGALGGLYAGHAWDAWGAGWTFTGGAICALLGMLILMTFTQAAPPRVADDGPAAV